MPLLAMLELGLIALAGYLLGSLNGSLVLGGLIAGPDVRAVGSGNPGGTNALRARGRKFALGVMAIDIGKGVLAAGLLPEMDIFLLPAGTGISQTSLTFASGGAAVLGHCYPVWFRFAGGKGAATAVGVVLAIAPVLLLPGTAVWVAVLIASGFVGLATISAAAALPIYVALTGIADRGELLTFLVVLALFILYTHRSNVRRMLRHEENRMDAAMVLRRPR